MNRFGMVRVSTLTPPAHVGNPALNAAEIVTGVKELNDSDIIVTPELGITGYSCGDLFAQERLLRGAWEAVLEVASAFKGADQLLAVGCPVRVAGALYNCAVLLNQGTVVGIVPKQYPPTYKEFYEARHFAAADISLPRTAAVYGREYPFGIDLLFRSGAVVVGVEVCEDLWVPLPASSFQAVAGATVLLNLSASNEVVGKSDYRVQLVQQQSARCMAGYLYCSAGPKESTAGIVMSGHNLICENGAVALESPRFERGRHSQTYDLDVEKLEHDRAQSNSFALCKRILPFAYRHEEFFLSAQDRHEELARFVPAMVFVPNSTLTKDGRCDDIFSIQVCGLAKRLEGLAARHMVLLKEEPPKIAIGVSGGLDSTLALLVACKTYDLMDWPRDRIFGRSLPGFGTSGRTQGNAKKLAGLLGINFEEIDIRRTALQHFMDLDYRPFGVDWEELSSGGDTVDEKVFQEWLMGQGGKQDVVFENVQARYRTSLLMNTGFVLGTGDMSEAALGWCTYNGDHMSMYNPNAGVPKTLVKTLVEWIAERKAKEMASGDPTNQLYHTLRDICETAISPELLPAAAGEIAQKTEDILGPYELHDFFLFHLTRNGFSPEKLAYLARNASGFSRKYKEAEIVGVLHTFLTRFFSNQFKRQAVPDGPKVGSVDLNPRGDWRMPPDADSTLWTRFDK